MRCADLELLLADYADGIADERGRRLVERHIQLCGHCRETVFGERLVAQQLKRLPLLPLGVQDRTARMRQRVAQKIERRPHFGSGSLLLRTSLALILGVLGLVLLILVVSVGV